MVAVAASVAFAAEASVQVKTENNLVNLDEETGDVTLLTPNRGGGDTYFDFAYSDERVGADLKLRMDEWFSEPDALSVWFKPIDILKVTAGTGIGVGLHSGNWQTILEAEHTKGLQVEVNVDALTFTAGIGSEWNGAFGNVSNQEADGGSAWGKVSYAIDGVGNVSVVGVYNAHNNWVNDSAYDKGLSTFAVPYTVGFGAGFDGAVADAGLTYFVDVAGYLGGKANDKDFWVDYLGAYEKAYTVDGEFKDTYGNRLSFANIHNNSLEFKAIAFAADAKYEANGLSAEILIPGMVQLWDMGDDLGYKIEDAAVDIGGNKDKYGKIGDYKFIVGTAARVAYDLGGVTPYLELKVGDWLAKGANLRVNFKPGVSGTFAGKLGWDIGFDAHVVPKNTELKNSAGDDYKTFYFSVPVSFTVSF